MKFDIAHANLVIIMENEYKLFATNQINPINYK